MEITPPLKQTSVGTPRNVFSLISMISQGFGEIPEYYGPGGHNGIDWPCAEGTEILAAHDGESFYYEERGLGDNFIGYGKYVTVRDRNNNFKTEYCHLSKVIKIGQVKAGDVIALSGNTGNSTGPHLHFTLKNPKAVDPVPYLAWFKNMKLTKEQVEKIYALWGLDDSGIAYWVGKELDDLLNARLKDELKQLKKYDS